MSRSVVVALLLSTCGCSFLSDFEGLAVTGPSDGGSQGSCLSPFGQNPREWTLAFHDEFEGNALDRSVWNDHIWYEPSDPLVNYKVENGVLKIWPDKGFVNRTLDTDGKYHQTYGFFEMRAKLPVGRGPRPAFWLFNHDHAVERPDISIMQAYPGGGPSSGWSDSRLHPTAYGVVVTPSQPGVVAGEKMHKTGDLSAEFHRYGAKWTETDVTFYFDGVEIARVGASMPRRMYLIVSLWFGSASGTPDATTPTGPTNAYEIDWVRAWRRGGPGCAS